MVDFTVILVLYKVNTCLSVVMASFVFYLILFRSPRQMNNLRWHMLNIQSMTFLETFYWCFLLAPRLHAYPVMHGYSVGLISIFFDVPLAILASVAIVLLCGIMGSLCVGFTFRYHMLMPQSEIAFIQWIIEKMETLAVVMGYGSCFVFGFLTKMSFMDEKSVKERLHEADPDYVIPEGSAIIGGIWLYPWAALAVICYAVLTIVFVIITLHSRKILQRAAKHSQSVETHKQALHILVLQLIFLYVVIVVPAFVASIFMLFGSGDYAFFLSEVLAPFCLACYTLKSLSTSFIVCYTIRPYREFIFGFVRPEMKVRNITMVAPSSG